MIHAKFPKKKLLNFWRGIALLHPFDQKIKTARLKTVVSSFENHTSTTAAVVATWESQEIVYE